MKLRTLGPVFLAAALAIPPVHAAVDLLAIGTISGAFGDLASQTAAPLENGVPGNLLGGIGSGLAYAGGNTFIGLPDRGPNAVDYNTAVDNTTSYITRFQTLTLGLTPNAPGAALPFSLTPTLKATTLLSSSSQLSYGSGSTVGLGSGVPALNAVNNTNYFTGRSDNFNPALPSTNPGNARFDPEGVRVSNDGKSVFISDEYGPYVYQFDRATGQRLRSFTLPANLAVANQSPVGNTEISGNTQGRVANKGMEGLAITPDGKTLVGIMQAPSIEDGGKTVRIVTIDIASGTTHQYAYTLTTGSGVSEIVAINNHEFLVDERDGKGLGDNSTAAVKQIFKIDIAGATDVSGISGSANLATLAVTKTTDPSGAAFIDVVKLLTDHGINAKDIPAKLEGMAFGADVVVDGHLKHTLYIGSDNDFLSTITDSNHPNGIANPNTFYVLGIDAGDLPTFQAQQLAAVPEPSTWALMLAGLGMIGLLLRRGMRVEG